MDVSPIASAAAANSASSSDRVQEAGLRRVPEVPLARVWTPPPPVIGGNVMVEFDRHAGSGAPVVNFIDKRTGETVNQLPAQQVLDAVTALVAMMKQREA